MAKNKNGKYANELEKIRMLKSINSVLKKGDVENALLSNSARDSEIVSDTVIEGMLDNLSSGRNPQKDIEVVEKLTRYGEGAEIRKSKIVKIQKRRGKIKVKRTTHIKKRKTKRSAARPKRRRR